MIRSGYSDEDIEVAPGTYKGGPEGVEMEIEVGYDPVNKPEHYASGDIECIDAMIAAYGTEAVKWFCACNAFKYQWRFPRKNGIEDLKKAEWYRNKYIELDKKEKK